MSRGEPLIDVVRDAFEGIRYMIIVVAYSSK